MPRKRMKSPICGVVLLPKNLNQSLFVLTERKIAKKGSILTEYSYNSLNKRMKCFCVNVPCA